jgi:uncharacterized protein YndB with AHSA1/START domain
MRIVFACEVELSGLVKTDGSWLAASIDATARSPARIEIPRSSTASCASRGILSPLGPIWTRIQQTAQKLSRVVHMKEKIKNKEIRHSFFIDGSPAVIADALMQAEHIQRWWTKEARVQDVKGVLERRGYGWEVELEMAHDSFTRTVVWQFRKSNMQNTNAWEGSTITFSLTPQTAGTRVDFSQTGCRESPCYEVCAQGWEFFVGRSQAVHRNRKGNSLS